MRAVLEEGRARGEAAVILFGDPAFYRRVGFEPGVTFGVPNPHTGQTLPDGTTIVAEENFLVSPLDDRARSLAGEIRCHPALTLPVEADDRSL
jgi:predicted N-acetyltransferase YhbS